MAKYGYRRKKKRKWILFLIILMLLAGGVTWYYFSVIAPMVLNIAKATVTLATSTAVNDAAYSCVSEDVKYSDLIEVVTDKDGNITMLQSNPYKLNAIAKKAENRTQENLDSFANSQISIPLGAFTGISILSGTGSPVKVDIIPLGTSAVKFVSSFEGAGINQTRHKIYLDVNADVFIVLPFIKETVTMTATALLAESVLVGKVPEIYFDGGGGSLNLIP